MAELDQLESINPDTKRVPKHRLTDANLARRMYQQDTENYLKRNKRNALVKGLIDGNPPFDQATIRKLGQSYRSNFNSGEGQSFLEVALTAFYDLTSEVDTIARVAVQMEHPMASEWSEAITRHFDWLLRQNASRDYTDQFSQHEMVVYGSGPVIWDDELNWIPKAIRHRYLLLPYDCPSDVDCWPRCCIEYEFTVGDLYKYISDADVARAMGWNVDGVKTSIIRAGANLPDYTDNWEAIQQRLRDNDIYWGEVCERVMVARLLVKEFADSDGVEHISDLWVDANGTNDQFLFKRYDRFETMSQAVCPYFYDRGDGGAHGIKGLGVKQYGLLLQSMRLLNTTVDQAYSAATTMVQAVGGAANQNLQVMHIGPYSVLPPGFNFIQRNMSGVVDAPLAMRRELQNTLMSNLSQYRQRLDKVEGNPKTATEVNAQMQQQSILGKTQISRYFSQKDQCLSEQFRRATNPQLVPALGKWAEQAIEFQMKCAADGVPLEAYRRCRVTATRTVGQGSSFLRTQSLLTLLQTVAAELPEEGRERLIRDFIASIAGQSLVLRYSPPEGQRPTEAQQQQQADVENGVLKQGGKVTITGQDNHATHLDVHLAFGDAAAGSVPQGAKAGDVLRALEAVGAHSAQHLQALAQSPLRQAEVSQYQERVASLAKATDQLAKHVAQQAKNGAANGNGNGADPEAAKAAMEMQLKKKQSDQALEIDRTKADQELQQSREAHMQTMALKDIEAAQKIKNDRLNAKAKAATSSRQSNTNK